MRTSAPGFTLIELLVVMAVLALLVTLVSPRYFQNIDRAKEATLRTNLLETRHAIDRYFTDKGRYPETLKDLVDERYLRDLPLDAITERTDTWTFIPPKQGTVGAIFDLHSGAKGNARDGTAYGSW